MAAMTTKSAIVKQLQGLTFAGKAGTGHWVMMDGPQEFGGSDAASRPKELLLRQRYGMKGSPIRFGAVGAVACILSIALLTGLSCSRSRDDSNEAESYSLSDSTKVDPVFFAYFAVFDSVVSDAFLGSRYPLTRIQMGVELMESATGIISKGEGNLLGIIDVTKQDVASWKQWYQQDRSTLRWDRRKKMPVVITDAK